MGIILNNRIKAQKAKISYALNKNDPEYMERKRERERQYRKENIEIFREKNRRYREKHQKEINLKAKQWKEKNKDRLEKLRLDNIEETRKQRREWFKKRRATDLRFNLCGRMSARMNVVLKKRGGSKMGESWEKLTGYSVEELISHIKKNFKEGMTWELVLSGEIHIDHKIPVSVFNFNSPKDLDFKRCYSLSNLQPLWKRDNILKGNKLEKSFQPMLRLEV